MNPKTFNQSINGLRAIAVFLVIAFHYELKPFSGGFIGVDVFFVISGYVITNSIYKKLAEGSFTLKNYFKRRFLRIFPALSVACFLTLLFSSVILFPADALRSAKHAIGSISFISNFLYWKEIGYFDVDNTFKPFLHTWSLSVEWQFYIFWPLAIYMCYRFQKIALLLLGLGIGIGILLSGLMADYKNFVFYMMPLRAWEFALGGIIVFISRMHILESKLVLPLFVSGLGIVLASSIIFNTDTIFPGFAAMLPCLGAFLIILSSQNNLQTILSHKCFQYFGNVSYSLYLYHWPVYILYKHYVFRSLGWTDFAVILPLVFILSHLSFICIEQPFRNNRVANIKIRAGFLTALSLVTIFVSLHVIQTDGQSNRYSAKESLLISHFQNAYKAYQKQHGIFYPNSTNEIWSAEHHAGIPCLYDQYKLKNPSDPILANCIIQNHVFQSDKKAHYIVIGDSNGKNVYEALQQAFPEYGFSMLMQSGCAPAEHDGCFSHLTKQLSLICNQTHIDGVILSARASKQSIENINQTMAFLNSINQKFIVFGATPMLRKTIDMTMIKKSYDLKTKTFSLPLNDAYFHPDIFYKDVQLERFANEHKGYFFDKKSAFCSDTECTMKTEEEAYPIYLDDQHLSHEGIKRLSHALQIDETINLFFDHKGQ